MPSAIGKRVSPGELSAIVFSRKTNQAVLTDDIGAQKLAHAVLGGKQVQSIPHLLAWLYFKFLLNDADKDQVVLDLQTLGRSLQPHLDDYHREAQRCRFLAHRSGA